MSKRLSRRCNQLIGILLILVPLLRLAPTAYAAPLASLPAQSGLGEVPWSPLLTYPLSERTDLNVNVANGNLIVHATDFAIHGTGQDLVVNRYYNSLLSAAGSVGYGWTLNLGADVQLQVGSNAVTYVGPSDAQFTFTKVGGAFRNPSGMDATLVQNGDGSYTLTFQSTGLRYSFTSVGVLTAEVDKNGNAINLGYNGNGSLNTVTDTQGRTTSFIYNSGYLAGITDSSGRHITYSQNVMQNVYNLVNVGGSGTSGETYTLAYNLSNQLNDLTDQMGNDTTITYGVDGRVGSVTLGASSAGKGQLFKYGYDANNNLTSITLPTGATTSTVYGTVSNFPSFFVPTSTIDAQGNQTADAYDGNGNLTTVTNQLPSQNTTRLYYNGNGTVNHVLDARGSTTSYGYDGVGNLIKITPPSPMQPTVIVPDSLSRAGSVTDGNGNQRTYTYDQQDHVLSIRYSRGTSYFLYNYDASGNNTFRQDLTGATYYFYDARNRMIEKDLPNGAGTFTYGYDAASNLTSLVDNATVSGQSMTVTYGYNAANLVTSLVENGKTTGFGYDQNHQRTSTTYPDGVVMSQSYDQSGRRTSIVGTNSSQTVLSSFTYSYTKPGGGDTLLPSSYSETLMSPSGSVATVNGSMTYDPLNRLGKWLVTKQSDGSVVHDYVYQYDGTSNRTQILADPQNSQGQIVSDPAQGLPHSNENDLSYTAAGTVNQIIAYGAAGTTPSTRTYAYDCRGQPDGQRWRGQPE